MANPKKHYSTAVYDFTVDGGAHGATHHIALADSATFPEDALITDITMYTYKDIVGSSSTLQIILGESGNTTYDMPITAAIAEATFADESVQSLLVPAPGAKTKKASVVKLDVGTANLTAGKVYIVIGYFLGSIVEA